MIRSLTQSSLKLRFFVVVVGAAVLSAGVYTLPDMPVDVLPEFTPPYVEIQTEALGLSAEEVEQMITVPLEQDLLNGVPWLDVIRSESLPGLSSIVLIFDRGTDPIRARQMVQERMTQAFALPHVSKPPTMLQPLSSLSRVMMIGLSSKDVSLIEMGVLARWTIGPRLMGVPGVANVAIWGQRDRQLQVQVDPKRLRDKGVSLQDILETTGNAMWVSSLSFVEASVPGTGGFIETPQQRLGIRHIFPISSPEGLAQVPIEGSPLTLGDVATVVEDHQPLIGDAISDSSSSLLLVLEKLPGANTLEVTRGVEEALAAMRPGLPGIEIDSSIYRPATFIEMAMGNITRALLLGLVLVALALFGFLYDWRCALTTLIPIVLSLAAAGLVLYVRGTTVNMMMIAGWLMALPVIIDDAIVDVGTIARRLRQSREAGSAESSTRIILGACLEVRRTLTYATLIIVVAMLPVFFLQGQSGAFLPSVAASYGLAVLVSMVVALVVTPALCFIFLRTYTSPRRGSTLTTWLTQRYNQALSRITRTPRQVYAATSVLILIGLVMLPIFRLSLLPLFKEQDLLIHFDSVPGTSLPEMNRIVAAAIRELSSIPGVRNVDAHVGRAIMSDQVVDTNSSELWVNLDSTANYEATVAAIEKVVHGYPGIQRKVQTYLQERSDQVALVPENSIVVRVYGDNLKVLRGTAEEVQQALTGIDGVVDSQVKLPLEQPTLEIEVNLAAAEHYGLKPGDVRRAAAVLLSGMQVGSLFEEQKVFDVVVWGTPETRRSLTSVQELLLDTPGGGQVRLGDVANVRVMSAASVIQHEAVRSYLDIRVAVDGRGLGTVASDIEQRLRDVHFPLEYHAEVLGGSKQQVAWQRSFSTAIAAAIGAFLLLQAALGSWRLASVIFLTLPVALVGGVLAAFAGGGIISLGSLLGFFTVLGVAVRQGMVTTRHFQHLEQHEGETFGPPLVRRGAQERLGPIFMTAFAAALAFLPFVFFGDIAGNELIHPMAVVILGGLVTSLVLNVFVLPALYLQWGRKAKIVTS